MRVGAAHTLVDEFLQAPRGRDPRPHADLDEGVDGACVLADRPPSEGGETGIGQNLPDGIFGRRALLPAVGLGQRLDEARGVVDRDILKRVGDTADNIFLADRPAEPLVAHRILPSCAPARRMMLSALSRSGASTMAPSTATAPPSGLAASTRSAQA